MDYIIWIVINLREIIYELFGNVDYLMSRLLQSEINIFSAFMDYYNLNV